MQAELRDPRHIRNYLDGGQGKFTLYNPESEVHFTYRMRKPAIVRDKGMSLVDVMMGQDNEQDYVFLGTYIEARGTFKHSGKSRVPVSHPSSRGMRWICKVAKGELVVDPLRFYHEGVCAKCGRTLTNPHSIECGIGPKCSGQ